MSVTSPIFSSEPTLIPRKSGFCLDNSHLFTTNVGTLTPCMVIETLPADEFSIGTAFDVKLPPLASDFYGKVDAHIELFWVSTRALWAGFKDFINEIPDPYSNFDFNANPVEFNQSADKNNLSSLATNNDCEGKVTFPRGPLNMRANSALGGVDEVTSLNVVDGIPQCLPSLAVDKSIFNTLCGPNTLADYLGIKSLGNTTPTGNYQINNALPFYAYHYIWNTWYRNPYVQADIFDRYITQGSSGFRVSALPYIYETGVTTYSNTTGTSVNKFVDGKFLTSLRQRNYSDDYFTTACPQPNHYCYAPGNAANGVSVASVLNLSGAEGGTAVTSQFSIPMLRVANSIQLFLDRLANSNSTNYKDKIRAQYGVTPDDLDLTPKYLGRVVTPIYNNSISNSTGIAASTGVATGSKTPWAGTMGDTIARPHGNSSGTMVSNFRCNDYGYLMAIFSLVPHSVYSTGTDRMFRHANRFDFADALFQNCGPQPINTYELTDFVAPNWNSVFGYVKPYAEYMFKRDTISGLFRSGSNLSAMCLQRSFAANSSPKINTAFLEIPTTALDEVFTAKASTSKVGCMVDSFFKVRAIRPLQSFTIPTLGTPEFMKTELRQHHGPHIAG